MTTTSVIAALLLVPIAMIDGVFLAETFLGLVGSRSSAIVPGPMPTIAVLMPAHDEAATLVAAGEMLARLIGAGARIVVVADNCSDDTAAVAHAAGCEVVMRYNAEQRGKGYALAAGRDYLTRRPVEVVVVLDADCSIDLSSLTLLAKRASTSGRVIQAAYLFRRNPAASPKVQISNFAFAVKNLVRQRGGQRLGAAAILTGSGMAFPWCVIADLDLATGNIVEDLALGVDLVCRQQAPIFEEGATVWSDASDTSGTETQRSRWEGGFIATARQFAAPLIRDGVIRRDFRWFWLGAHLLVPALSIVLTLNLASLVAFVALAIIAVEPWPALAAAILLLLIAIAVVAAWLAEGRRHMSPWVIVQIPLYLAWKVALYARLLTGRRSAAWTRTERVGKP